MPFWDKAAKAAKDAADRATFEANKLVRVQRKQGTLNDLRAKKQTRMGDLGQMALTLYHNGALTDPSIAALAQEVSDLEAQINAQQMKVDSIKAEQNMPAADVASAPPPAYT